MFINYAINVLGYRQKYVLSASLTMLYNDCV